MKRSFNQWRKSKTPEFYKLDTETKMREAYEAGAKHATESMQTELLRLLGLARPGEPERSEPTKHPVTELPQTPSYGDHTVEIMTLLERHQAVSHKTLTAYKLFYSSTEATQALELLEQKGLIRAILHVDGITHYEKA